MTNIERPAWLAEAVAASGRARSLPKREPVVRSGEIRVLSPGRTGEGENRVVLVLKVDDARKVASVALTSTETEYACDWDYLVSKNETGLAYDLMVETDIVSPVWIDQLQLRLASVPPELFSAIGSWNPERSDSWIAEVNRHGPPILGRSDPRWGYREQELESLNSLAQECSTRLIEGATFDPALLTLLNEFDENQRDEMLVAILAASEREGASIHETTLDVFIERVTDLDPDVFVALEPLLNLASSRHLDRTERDNSSITWPEREGTPVIDKITEARNRIVAAEMQRGRKVIHMVSESTVWREFVPMRFSTHETQHLFVVPERLCV